MQNEPVGPEWNSINQFKDNIKPKVITKAGQVITPAKLPRSIQQKKKVWYCILNWSYLLGIQMLVHQLAGWEFLASQ